jgi:hypothetical protein
MKRRADGSRWPACSTCLDRLPENRNGGNGSENQNPDNTGGGVNGGR